MQRQRYPIVSYTTRLKLFWINVHVSACPHLQVLGCNLHGLHSVGRKTVHSGTTRWRAPETRAERATTDHAQAGAHAVIAHGHATGKSQAQGRLESDTSTPRSSQSRRQSPHPSRRQSRSQSRRQSRRQSRCRLLGRVNLLNLSTISSAELRCRRRCAAGPWAATSARRRGRRGGAGASR